MSAQVKFLVAVLLCALLAAGCAPEPPNPPGVRVYRQPQVRVETQLPATDTPLPQATGTATLEPAATSEISAWPTMTDEEYIQYLADTVDTLFNKIEGELDRTDVEP
jgi:hypothetical protein